MENLTKIPGLQHIAETIFLTLTFGDILECTQVNESWKMIVDNPSFWLRKCVQNPTFENKSAWKKLIQLTKQTFFEKKLSLHLQRCAQNMWGGENTHFLNKVNNSFCPIYWSMEYCGDSIGAGFIRELAPLSKNINRNNFCGRSLIHEAAQYGYIGIIKNPNAAEEYGLKVTPMHVAARKC